MSETNINDSMPNKESNEKKTINIGNIASLKAPSDYEETKNKPAPREFVKKLGDTLLDKINNELVLSINDTFKTLSDELGNKTQKLTQDLSELSMKFDDSTNGSNEWTL